jgi:hypothetical protein
LPGHITLPLRKTVALEYLMNSAGRKTAAVVPMPAWRKLLEALEELEDIRAYDQAKRRKSDSVPLDEALARINARKAGRCTA